LQKLIDVTDLYKYDLLAGAASASLPDEDHFSHRLPGVRVSKKFYCFIGREDFSKLAFLPGVAAHGGFLFIFIPDPKQEF